MRFIIIITIFVMSGLCSCRSQKNVVEQHTGFSEVNLEKSEQSSTTDSLVAVFRESSDSQLSDVTITFFPPDSAHPDARAAPATIHIGSVSHRAAKDSDLSLISKSNAVGSASLDSLSTLAKSSDIASEVNILSPPSGIVALLLLGLLVIAAILFIFYRIRSPTQ